MTEDVRNMRGNGSSIEDEVVCLLFLRALQDEYNVFRQMLERERQELTIDRLRTELRARYDLLKEGKSSKTSDTAFLASGTKRGNSGRRREECGNVSGNKQKDGGATRKDSNGQGSSSGAGGSNGAPSGKKVEPTHCNICKETRHKWSKCPKRICSVFREIGHDPNSCPQIVKEDANLTISDRDRLSTGDELDGMCEYLPSQYALDAFFSVSGGKLFDPDSGIREGVGCEVGELKSWISDDGASRHITSSHDLMINYRECSGIVRTAGGDALPIEGVGDILLRFPSDSGAFDIQLLNVAFVPQLSHNLLSLQQFTVAHHIYFSTKNGVELQFKSGRTLQARKFGRTNVLRGYRMTRKDDAPGVKPLNFNMDVDINVFHCSFGHVLEGLLRETAKQQNVNLIGTLRECQGCSTAKGRAKLTATTTGTRAVKPGGRVFLDVCGEKSVQSIGGKKYMLMIQDGFTRFNAVYFMRSKDDISRYFRQYLEEYRFTGVPCPVETVRTDGAAEFKGGASADLCRERGIRQEFTTADSPQFNGVAERGIAMMDSAGKAAIIQAGLYFRGMGIPSRNSLWAA